ECGVVFAVEWSALRDAASRRSCWPPAILSLDNHAPAAREAFSAPSADAPAAVPGSCLPATVAFDSGAGAAHDSDPAARPPLHAASAAYSRSDERSHTSGR